VTRRLDVYKKQTAPLLDYFGKTGVPVQPVDGDRSIEDVQHEILRIVEQ
jgi:adenylate kinase family enzyme